jgi:titin
MVASSADTFTVTTNANNGAGSLRRAILDANATRGADVIAFNLAGPGPHSINLLSPLPPVTDPVLIDGATQPGYAGLPLIELNGAGAGPAADGLWITVGNSSVRGLAINRFGGHGIRLESGDNNQVVGNFIGMDATGTNASGNGAGGILVLDSGGNNIGGSGARTRNLISGNGAYGVALSGEFARFNTIQGNLIGTDLTGTRALPNAGGGVLVEAGAQANTIGGTNVAGRNLISGNGAHGVAILSADANVIQGNFIGTDLSGSTPLPNRGSGVLLSNAAASTLGGAETGVRNVISGNLSHGLQVVGAAATNNVVQNNFIGTDVTGAKPLANRGSGVLLNAPATTLGGVEEGAGNVISGNGMSGVRLDGVEATGNVVQGNFIGTDASGAVAVANGADGITVVNAPANTLGGTEPGAGSVISGNIHSGISLAGSNAVDNVIQGNRIGTDRNGTFAVPNVEHGITAGEGANRITLGGPEIGARNLVAGNRGHGLDLRSADNQVQGNFIGTDLTGTQPLPNQGDGIVLRSRNNLVGGLAFGAGNRVAFNRGDGVRVSEEAGPGNAIFANAIFGNRGLGINLQPPGEPPHTVTPNDPLDADTGPNDLQNSPVITNAALNGGMVMVRGTLNSKPDRSCSIDFYANTRTEPSGPAEGELYLGFTTCNTDSQGRGSFIFTVSGMVSNQSVTATATDMDTGDTSEFSVAAGGVRIVSVERSGADLKLSFSTWPGVNHRLEVATALGSSVVWNAVPGASNVAGTGGVVMRTDFGAASASPRFYRVRVMP